MFLLPQVSRAADVPAFSASFGLEHPLVGVIVRPPHDCILSIAWILSRMIGRYATRRIREGLRDTTPVVYHQGPCRTD